MTVHSSACPAAREWLETPVADARQPVAFCDGVGVSPEAAMSRLTELLCRARQPALWGFSWTSCETQSLAIDLADQQGALWVPNLGDGERASHATLQGVGNVTASLGEVRARADLLIYWQSDALTTHPCFARRVLRGGPARYVVAVGPENPTTATADLHIPLAGESDLPALSLLGSLVAGKPFDRERATRAGLPVDAFEQLATRLMGCQFGVFLRGPKMSPTAHRTLTEVVMGLNQVTSVVALGLGEAGNKAGAASTLAWKTGYAGGVDFSPGYPRDLGDMVMSSDWPARAGVDLLLCVSDDPSPLANKLPSLPLVYLGTDAAAQKENAVVAIETAKFGLHEWGTILRGDEVPLPLRPLLPAPVPTMGERLQQLKESLAALR